MHDPHLHLFGALTPGEALDLAQGHAVDWAWLAGRWREAGLLPPDFAALARRRRDDPAGAEVALASALAHGPTGFAAFQARYDLLVACSRWACGGHQVWSAAQADEIDRVCALVGGRGAGEARILLPASALACWAEAALDHLLHAAARHGLVIAVSLPRADPLRHWTIVAEAAARHANLAGIDLCGIEDEPSAHAPLAAAIAAWNAAHAPRRLTLLIHVGEQLDAVQPLTALRRVQDAAELGADRLGHALAARLDPVAWPATPAWQRGDARLADLRWLLRLGLDLGPGAAVLADDLRLLAGRDGAQQVAAPPMDPGLLRAAQELVLARIRAREAVIEVCPTSNRLVSGIPIARHGVGRLREAGVRWVVGSDDPGLLGTSLAAEQALLRP